MYCTQCGTLVADDAKSCSKCGKYINEGTSEKSNKYPSITDDSAMPRKLWLYIVGVSLVGTYAAMFIPSLAGHRINPQTGLYSMLWTGLFFYLWWKRHARKGWHGALLGSALGFFAFIVASFIGSLMTH